MCGPTNVNAVKMVYILHNLHRGEENGQVVMHTLTHSADFAQQSAKVKSSLHFTKYFYC